MAAIVNKNAFTYYLTDIVVEEQYGENGRTEPAAALLAGHLRSFIDELWGDEELLPVKAANALLKKAVVAATRKAIEDLRKQMDCFLAEMAVKD